MTLSKAIEIKQLALDTGIINDPNDFKVADRLSTEALKRIQECRLADHTIKEDLLPGETKD